MNEEEKKEFLRIKTKYKQTWLDNFDMDFLINLSEKLQKECDFQYMKEKIDKQQTQIRELTDKKNVVDLDYKEEYYNLQKENYELKKKIEAYQEALLNICSK